MLSWFVNAALWLWEQMTGVLPVERWVQAVTGPLKQLAQAFVILAILFFVVLAHGWGLESAQRFVLELLILLLMLGCVVIVAILASKSGDPLYPPYERALRRGRNYGVTGREKTRDEIQAEPLVDPVPQLPLAPPDRRLGR